MKDMNKFFTGFINLKIQTCKSARGDYVVKLSASHHEYFWERKDAKEFIKNYSKEIQRC